MNSSAPAAPGHNVFHHMEREPASSPQDNTIKSGSETGSGGLSGQASRWFRDWWRPSPRSASSYWLTRFVILRLLGLVYCVAFLVAAQQIVPLIGRNGLLPAETFMHRVEAHFGSRWAAFLELPGLFWFNGSDRFMTASAWTGVGLS